jgi:dTDP-4-amino-4,6-dideoxygalactose transaminase
MPTLVTVPYVDLARQHAEIKDQLLAAAGRVIERGDFILGTETAEFERRFAELCGTSHAVGLNSGMDALVLSLKALDIGEGDEVITAPNSFVASAACIALVGARPVFVDVDESFNLDPDKVEAAITPRTKAILPIHLTGRPAAMEELVEIAQRFNLLIIEDAAQAVLAERHGKRVGAWGTAGCFSLHPLKTLNACGDGGVVTTNDARLAERLRTLRNLGLRTRDDCVEWSTNSRLDTMQAAMLLVKLDYLERWTKRRRENAAYYFKHLAGLPGLMLPVDLPDEVQVHHTFVVLAERRDALKAFLDNRGVGTSSHYPTPIHLQTAAASLGYRRGDFPMTEWQAERILSLPVHQHLELHELAYVCEAISEFLRRPT